jgi:hypothetical protein
MFKDVDWLLVAVIFAFVYFAVIYGMPLAINSSSTFR